MIWSFEVLMSNYLFNFCANKSDVFAVMFEDSKIGKSFCPGFCPSLRFYAIYYLD